MLVSLLAISGNFSNYIWLNIILSFLLVTLVILISAFVTMILMVKRRKSTVEKYRGKAKSRNKK